MSASFKTLSGKNEEVPAFHHVNYEEKPEGSLRQLSEGKWLVRYRPREQGTYKFSVTIHGFKPGKYLIEHWDSFIGQFLRSNPLKAMVKLRFSR